MTAEWWGVIATGATAVLALLAGAWSLILQAWGRRVVRFWVHDGRTSWTLEHHRTSPTVEFKLSNVGDAPALKVEVDTPGLHLSTPVGRGSATFESLAIMPSGTSVDLHLTVPIEEWDTATLHVSWTTTPLRRPFSRGATTIRLADALPRPQVTWWSRPTSTGRTTLRSAPTLDEARRLRDLDDADPK